MGVLGTKKVFGIHKCSMELPARTIKAASRGDSLIFKSIYALQHYICSVNVERSERTGNDRGALSSEVVGVEDDVVAVAVFESLLRLESLAEHVCGNQRSSEGSDCFGEVGVEIYLVAFFADVNVDRALRIHEEVLLLTEALGAAEICVAVDPDGELVEMGLCDLHHVGRVGLQVELLDPVFVEGVVVPDVGADYALFFPDLAVVEAGNQGFLRVLLEEDVVIETVVAVEDRHEAHDFGPVREVVRRVAPVGALADGCECAADEVVDHCDALCCDAERCVGEQDVVVNQCRAVADFDEDVFAAHAALKRCCVFWTLVVVQEIARDACALSFPVGPDAHDAVVDVVASHDDVDRCVELDAGNFGAAQFHHVVDVVDVVVFDDGEDCAHAADDAALFTVVDVVAADDVTADVFFEPAVILAAADCVTLHLCGALQVFVCEVVIVLGIQVFAEADAGALGEVDFVVFDDPAL